MMHEKILLLASIFFASIGLQNQSVRIDHEIVKATVNPGNTVFAEANLTLPEIAPQVKVKFSAPRANIYAKNYLLVDLGSGTVLASKAESDRVPIASTTKIMTAVIVLENFQLDETVTISETAANQIGATANFRVGEKIKVIDLLKCLLIKSANGAAYALAEHLNGPGEKGPQKFIALMNDKATSLGMANTEYHDPAGLDVTGWSSARDLVTITTQALKNPVFAEIVKTPSAVVTDVTGQIWHKLENSNRLVKDWDYPGAIGVKTGFMPEAGHCLVSAAKRDDHTLISVVLNTNADTPTASAEESRKLLDWGFTNTIWE